MKRFFQFIRNKDVRHAALQKTFPRVVIGLLICFLWDRFLNSGGRLNVYGHAFMAVGLIYAALSWLNYLSLDGVNAPEIFKKKLFKKPPKRKFLDTYCENLTRKAREGKLDDIIGRDREIYRTIQILSRRQKNNPCLIGEAGVGKTAIAEGIAERIAKGQVPIGLRDKEIFLLDLTSLVAGTQFRGQFEQRVKGLLSEVKAAGTDDLNFSAGEGGL